MSNKNWIPKATSIELFFVLEEMLNWYKTNVFEVQAIF